MSWKIALVVALITALLLGLITAPVADFVTRKMKVSNMEGGRGYMVMFLILAALIGGVIIGLIGTRIAGAVVWSQFWKAEGIALLIGSASIFGIAGLCLLSVPKQPFLNGRAIALDIEIFVPRELAPAGPPTEKNLYLSLYANRDDNRYVPIDTARVVWEDDTLVIRTQADLNTVSAERMLSLTVNDTVGYTLDMVLQPRPRKADLGWTDRFRMRLSKITGTAYTFTNVLVRYRVVERPEGTAE